MKKFLSGIVFFSFIASASVTAVKLNYECQLNHRVKKARLEVSLDLNSRWMETYLDDGVVIKGYATETFDPQNNTTIYFVQGVLAPYSQQLALYVRDGGNWAQFKRTYGGEPFVCSPK